MHLIMKESPTLCALTLKVRVLNIELLQQLRISKTFNLSLGGALVMLFDYRHSYIYNNEKFENLHKSNHKVPM